jgi:carboxypeptidase Taq
MFGYFPTYTLGNLIAAQLYRSAEESLGDLESHFASGRFAPLLEWLRANVHRSIARTPDLVRSVTGQPLGHQAFVDEVTRRMAPIYGL